MQTGNRDPRPIYTKLAEDFRQRIMAGVIREGEQLPSVRELASRLAVNPNTIQRAYRELEAEGWVESIPGKGSFARNTAGAGEKRKAELLQSLDALTRELRNLGLTEEELIAHIKGGNSHV